jgi:hypothetical protein
MSRRTPMNLDRGHQRACFFFERPPLHLSWFARQRCADLRSIELYIYMSVYIGQCRRSVYFPCETRSRPGLFSVRNQESTWTLFRAKPGDRTWSRKRACDDGPKKFSEKPTRLNDVYQLECLLYDIRRLFANGGSKHSSYEMYQTMHTKMIFFRGILVRII